MKSDEYVRYVTEHVVRYMETPREKRKEARMIHKANRPPLRNQLFGRIPEALSYYVAAIQKRMNRFRRRH